MGGDSYMVLYDAREHWPALWFALPGCLFIGISWFGWRSRASPFGWKWPADTRPWLRSLQAGCMLAFSVFVTGAVVIGSTCDSVSAHRLLENGEAQVVEGVVTHFEPGSKRARLEVGGVKFEYSPSELSPAYTECRAAFGNGSQVRIHYTRRRGIDAILKFELYEGAVCR